MRFLTFILVHFVPSKCAAHFIAYPAVTGRFPALFTTLPDIFWGELLGPGGAKLAPIQLRARRPRIGSQQPNKTDLGSRSDALNTFSLVKNMSKIAPL